MLSIKDVPAEAPWEIATRAANSQSVAYDMLVREIIGDKIDEYLEFDYGSRRQGIKSIG